MNLHEYQAKELLKQHGVPVPDGGVVWNAEGAVDVANRLGGSRWVVKAQVHAGGRGKAGGVKLVDNKTDLQDVVRSLLNTRLVTYQTTAEGQPVNQIWIEQPCDIAKELYLGMVVDRATQRIAIMASTEGGVDIETVADKTPEKIFTVTVDPFIGLQPFQCRDLFFKLQLDTALMRSFTQLLMRLYDVFVTYDLSLCEINPLVITRDDQLLCLDAKFNIDDNAMYRQPKLTGMRDTTQEDARETRAQQWDLNYISLEGNIGCMVNGAGLAMATMDLIQLQGGQPANFLDVGGSATQERVSEAFKIIVSDPQVKGILVNIFGGIVRCDLIADGIIHAVEDVGVSVPVVVRLAGNRADLGGQKLAESGLNIIAANGFSDAAARVVAAVHSQ